MVLRAFLPCLLCLLSVALCAQTPDIDSIAAATLAMPDAPEKARMLARTAGDIRDYSATLPFVLLDSALALSKRLKYPAGEGYACIVRSALLERRGENEQAQQLASRAIAILDSAQEERLLAQAYNQLANIRRVTGNLAEAVVLYQHSLAIRERLDSTAIGVPLANIGSLYTDMKQAEKGLHYLLRAMKVFERNNDSFHIVMIYNTIGEIYQGQKEYPVATGYFMKSIQIARAINDREGLQYSYENISEVYRQRQEYKKAIEYGELSLKLARELEFEAELLASGHSLCTTYLKAGKARRAIALGEELEPKALEKNLAIVHMNYLNILSKAHRKAWHPVRAGQYRVSYEAKRQELLKDPMIRKMLETLEQEEIAN